MSGVLKYEPALDGLRAYAVLVVMLAHAFPKHWSGGWIGVELFFVLSGYLITRILRAEYEATGSIDLWRFYLRRAMRLMPALWCMLAFVSLFAFTSSDPVGHAKSLIMGATYLMNWSRAFDWAPSGYIGHTWTLAIEEQYYLLWPLLFPLFRKRPLLLIGIVIALVMAWRFNLILDRPNSNRIYNGFDTHADPLMIGCALAFVKISEVWRTRIYRALPLIIVTLLACSFFSVSRPMLVAGIPFIALLNAGLIVASERGWFNRILSAKPMVFTGKISYGLYLWHLPLLLIAEERLPWLPSIAVLVAAYAVATLSWFTVERYFRRLKARMDRPAIAAQPA